MVGRRALALAAAGLAASCALAESPAPPGGWPAEKCARYSAAWTEALRRYGDKGLGAEFLASHERFLASGCEERKVCPRSNEEFAIANAMVIAAMNAGMASTFPPFSCTR